MTQKIKDRDDWWCVLPGAKAWGEEAARKRRYRRYVSTLLSTLGIVMCIIIMALLCLGCGTYDLPLSTVRYQIRGVVVHAETDGHPSSSVLSDATETFIAAVVEVIGVSVQDSEKAFGKLRTIAFYDFGFDLDDGRIVPGLYHPYSRAISLTYTPHCQWAYTYYHELCHHYEAMLYGNPDGDHENLLWWDIVSYVAHTFWTQANSRYVCGRGE
jgi:hypothetical protein